MAVCKFWVQGNCRFGNSCKFEHPIANQNRFGAFAAPSSNATSLAAGQKGPDNSYSISTAGIVKDLTEERPTWIFSAYGPGRDAPVQLFGGSQTEQSFEELRLHHWKALASGNPQPAINDIDSLHQQVQHRMENALKSPAEAMRYVLEGENQHPNRLDICESNSLQNTTGDLATGGNRSGQQASTFRSAGQSSLANPFAKPAVSSSGFGATPSPFSQGAGSAFGKPTQLNSGSFGQPSQAAEGAFGKPPQQMPAFGQPSPAGPVSGFGQQSQLGGMSVFGKPTQQPSTVSAFGQPSSLGQKPAFGAPSFGQPSQPAASGFSKFATPALGSTFGQPSQPEQHAGGGVFGQSSQLGGGVPSGQSSGPIKGPSPFLAAAGNTARPFATQGNIDSTAGSNAPNPFSSAGPTQANPFAQAAPSSSPSAFGQVKAIANPFGGGNQSNRSEDQLRAGVALTPSNQFNPLGPSAPNPFQQTASARPAFGQPGGVGLFSSAQAATTAFASAAPLQTSGNVTTPSGNGGPGGPDAERQHPPIQSYALHDTSGNLVQFKGHAVSYQTKDGAVFPVISSAGGKSAKVWFPNGPPLYNKDTEFDREAYSSEIKTQYDAFMRTGKFDRGLMPELPPRREWCLWDF